MRVRLEPIGEEIECRPEETVLDAAFRQGLNLVHGCREGQCSACKCFLLEGDIASKPHSSFALAESEAASGYALMCRAMPETDLVVELLHFDPDAYRLEHPIRDGQATVVALEPLTADITRLVLRVDAPADFAFTPGQYVDLHVPGGEGRRSFSMANLPGEGTIELIIKRYPGGRVSGMLGGEIGEGTELRFTGPYGALRLHGGQAPILMVAGGSGMAPVLSLLRQVAAEGCARPLCFFFGARTAQDLFLEDEVAQLGARLVDFQFLPVTGRFVHEAVDEFLATGQISDPDVYMCGPPPMIDAAQEMLVGTHGVPESRIFTDRFTTSAQAAPAEAGPPVKHAAPAAPSTGADAVAPAGEEDVREFAWYAPAGRRRTLYEDVTVDTQPSVHRHLTRGWPLHFADGRGTWQQDSTALRSGDWFAFRDPAQQWERPFYQRGASLERTLEAAMHSAARDGVLADLAPEWREFLRRHLQVAAFVEHGLWFALATAGRECLSDTLATCVGLQAAMKQRSAQAMVLHAMDLEPHLGPMPIEAARDAFLNEAAWQPARRLLEKLAATRDWGEVIVAANLCFEPTVGTLLRREIGIRAATAAEDSVTPVLARAAGEESEWARDWTTTLTRMLLEDHDHAAWNREVLHGWVADWAPECRHAASAIAELATVEASWLEHAEEEILDEAGLGSDADQAPATAPAPRGRVVRRRRPAKAGGAPARAADGDSYDYVGIVMARSAEGDAVADVLGRRADVEVLEQPSFWEIRARDRLTIAYQDISSVLGYAIDAYSIQHEMSTHYGRMVATDDALMLFSDPSEAMEHLLA